MAGHTYGVAGRHACTTRSIQAKVCDAGTARGVVRVRSRNKLSGLRLSVRDVFDVPRRHAHPMNGGTDKVRVVQQPLLGARRTN
eukprot:9618908-Heterocapsa_arctica.AAC.1